MKKKHFNEEIDLTNIIFNLWNNKIKIIVITASFIILGFLYFYSLEKKFLAITNIKPISTFEAQKYKLFNSIAEEILTEVAPTEVAPTEVALTEVALTEKNIIKFRQQNLLDLFINKIQTEDLLEKAIIKFQLVNKDNFENEAVYKEAVKKTAILIIDQITSPINDKKDDRGSGLYWKINFKISNKETWRDFLEYLEKQANQEIRESLIKRFNTEMEILDLNLKFKIEDIEKSISNELDDYKTFITNRLAFLEEQAEIARALNIKKNTFEANFQTDIAFISSNITSENSYYLKGYEMIEKEMSLINSRKNLKAFIPNLLKLEKNKRSILQDKKIERLKILFSETPINFEKNFSAAKIDYVATEYKSQKSLLKITVISTILGFLISLIYIAFNSIIANRK